MLCNDGAHAMIQLGIPYIPVTHSLQVGSASNHVAIDAAVASGFGSSAMKLGQEGSGEAPAATAEAAQACCMILQFNRSTLKVPY